MSQNDFNIANQGFPATRADINSALQALASNSAGTSEPSTTYAYQFWYDETNELLKMRNSDNDAWITIGSFDQATDTFTPVGVTTDKIEEGNSSVEVVDTGTGYVAITVDGAEAARVDGSGNLLVGKTAESGNTAGHFFSPTGYQRSTRNGGIQILNRISSDGAMIDFQRDGSAVGVIGAASSKIYIGTNEVGLHFTAGATDRIQPWNTSTNTAADASIDLGISSARFRNLYLSGGVYLGGTGAANYLDDYEEGTWTVSLTPSTSGSISLGISGGAYYTKIGNAVTITITAENNSSSSPVGYVSLNLPFAAASGSQKGRASLSCYFDGVAGSNVADFMALTIDGTSEARIYLGDNPITQSDSAQQFDGSCYFLISGTYFTDA